MIKKGLTYLFKTLLVVVMLIGVYLLSAYTCQYITINDSYVKPVNGTEVFLISNGVHTDICLPLDENNNIWEGLFKTNQFNELINQPKYISFGWGDKGFYLDTPTWDDLSVKTALKAALIPSPTAIHVTYKINKPKLSDNVKSFMVNKVSLNKIVSFIKTYVKIKNKQSILIDCCRYPGVYDNFYEAKGDYHVFNTCNVWTNNAIKQAGVKTSIWTPFPSAILMQFE